MKKIESVAQFERGEIARKTLQDILDRMSKLNDCCESFEAEEWAWLQDVFKGFLDAKEDLRSRVAEYEEIQDLLHGVTG